jgi:peptidyl-prolyl cis-trans isomerase B (cyclophilin B)
MEGMRISWWIMPRPAGIVVDMKLKFLCFGLSFALALMGTRADENKPMNNDNEVAVIKTSEGDMTIQFWNDAAPETIANFKKLAQAGFYNGTIFHRVVKGFMIQGGDPNSKDPAKESSYGTGDAGHKIKAEFNDHSHDRGVISMARSSDPNSASCQFFICLAPVHRLDHQYTTFGKLIKGEAVLDKIGDTETVMGSDGAKSKPVNRMTIERIDIVPASEVK